MNEVSAATGLYLKKLTKECFDQIEGVPDEDVNSWRPALALQDINTMFALLTHVISSGEFWVLSVAAELPSHRVRATEFSATGDVAALRARAGVWLSACETLLATLTPADFERVVRYKSSTTGAPSSDTIANCLIHAVDHTANHLGHLQIQRQIWNAERGPR